MILLLNVYSYCFLWLCMQATGLPGCTVNPGSFTTCWINYSNGSIAVGTGPPGSSLSFTWHDSEPPIADIQHVGLSCWDKQVSYRNVQLLPELPPARLQELQDELQQRQMLQLQCQEQQQHQDQLVQEQQQQQTATQQQDPVAAALSNGKSATRTHQSDLQGQHQAAAGTSVLPLLQLVQSAIVSQLQPCDVCHMLQLAEALLPRTQVLYEAAVQLAGECFGQLVQHHLQELAMLPMDVLMDVMHEPLLVRANACNSCMQCVNHPRHACSRTQAWISPGRVVAVSGQGRDKVL